MRRLRPGIGTELLPVALVLLGLASTLGLVIHTYYRSITLQKRALSEKSIAPAVIVTQVPEPEPEPEPDPPPPVILPVVASKPVEDPTKPILARLAEEE